MTHSSSDWGFASMDGLLTEHPGQLPKPAWVRQHPAAAGMASGNTRMSLLSIFPRLLGVAFNPEEDTRKGWAEERTSLRFF